MRRPKESERGSVIVEFLLVFPAFLVLAMFVLEGSLMWSDRHIERLAAFEAARTLVAANLDEFNGPSRITNPCDAPNAMKRAKQAALRKIAIISPPLPLFLAKLGKVAGNLNFGVGTDLTPKGDAMLRLAKRWPTAVASTEMHCSYDTGLKQVNVKLTYHRMLQTPLIDRVIYVVYQLGQINKRTPVELSLDENFLSVTAASDSPPAVSQMRDALKKSFDTVGTLGLSMGDAVNFMRDIPGVDHVFSQVTPAPQDVTTPLGDARAAGLNALNGSLLGSGVDQQAKLLTGMVAMVPEALRRIPMTVEVSLQRDVYSSTAIAATTPGQEVKERPWAGHMQGVFDMDLGSQFRAWGHKMSDPLVNLRDNATALENLK